MSLNNFTEKIYVQNSKNRNMTSEWYMNTSERRKKNRRNKIK